MQIQDLYIVVHDKVYNATSFVDEHPYVLFSPLCRFHFPLYLFFGNAWEQYLEIVDAAECFPAANSRLRLSKRAQGTSSGECTMQRG